MHQWHIVHGQDGYAVEIIEVPWWAVAGSQMAEWLTVGHIICGCNLPEWASKVPLGRANYDEACDDEDPYLINSLAACLSSLYTWGVGLDWRYQRKAHRQHVSETVARLLEPSLVDVINADHEDEASL